MPVIRSDLRPYQRELRRRQAAQPSLEALQSQFAGLSEAEEIERLERLIGFLRRRQQRLEERHG